MLCGIDEAGRGPLIGPLIMAGVAISEDKLPELEKLGVKDSKFLTPSRRKQLYSEIIKIVDGYHIVEVSAQEIDQRKSVGTNLNKLEAIKAAEIVASLSPKKVILDSPEPADAQKFARMVMKYIPEIKVDIIAEHKADMNHKVVAAASILAKVTRDARVEDIKKLAGVDFGSGYMSDPLCKKFLEEHFEGNISEHIRKCWNPYIVEREKREQKNILDF